MGLWRGARFILKVMLVAVLVSLIAVVAAYFFAARGPTIESNSVLWLRIPNQLAEHQVDDIWSQLLGRRDTVSSVIEALRKAKVDDRIRGVVLVPPFEAGLWGKVQEIRSAIVDFKESGKPILSYLEYGGGRQFYLATASDRIYLQPSSSLDLVGVATHDFFLRGALDKLGIFPDILHAGEYKTASNLYTEATFTPEHREMSESLNREFFDQLIQGIAEGRGMTAAGVEALLDEGPFLPDAAVEVGLIDGLLYEDELVGALGLDREPTRLDYDTYRRVEAHSLGLNRGPTIAVVYAVGAINFGTSGIDMQGGDVLGSETLVEAIRSARDDRSVEAIVLRINSPGGVAIASDIIWREVVLAREEKPVIASMSDVAASGGYYIAMSANAIVAQPGTLTGSIGVIGGKFAFDGMLEKLGINVEPVGYGRHSDLFSPITSFSEGGRAAMQVQIDAIYDRFLDNAAEGRGMTREAVHEVGQGRVWTGRQAQSVGLVDELGGLDRAVALAKAAAGIDEDEEVSIITYPRPRSFFEQLSRFPFVRGIAARLGWAPMPGGPLWMAATIPLRVLRTGQPLALMPFVSVW